MRIYLMRHAEAVSLGFDVSDDMRWLTASGRQLARRVGERLASLGVTVDAIVSSPLVRAVQSADLAAVGMGFGEAISVLDELRPSGFPRGIADTIAEFGESVVLVGHEPSISALAAFLGNETQLRPFRTGQVVLIEDGRPAWTLPPDSDAKQSLS